MVLAESKSRVFGGCFFVGGGGGVTIGQDLQPLSAKVMLHETSLERNSINGILAH